MSFRYLVSVLANLEHGLLPHLLVSSTVSNIHVFLVPEDFQVDEGVILILPVKKLAINHKGYKMYPAIVHTFSEGHFFHR